MANIVDEIATLPAKTVGRIMTEVGIKSPTNRKGPKTYKSRPPHTAAGKIVQMDASDHQWFPWGRATLHGIIGDTGTILALWFEKHVCLEGYLHAVRIMIERHGIPQLAYTDHNTIFSDTSFGKELLALGIDHSYISAWSPEENSRIERLWKALQPRLSSELRTRGFMSLAEANAWLPEYVAKLNSRKKPTAPSDHTIS